MEVKSFKRVLACFAESPAAIDLAKGEFVVQLRDEVISGALSRRDGALFVDEGGGAVTAESWLVNRVARLPLLADRILSEVRDVENFVVPSGSLVPAIDQDPAGSGRIVEDAVTTCFAQLSRRVPGTTSVLYLTSDAGEGKTTVISRLARKVAESFKRREIDWLLLPVPMGGRAFLRFDELVVSSLMQRYRFSYWYFEGFIELVRMGVVVPAFDGFEEMIVEESSGEAVSAVGNLVNQLDSEGSVLLAARKAFFEYQSFRTQARLFDAIGREDSVEFSRLALMRWSRAQFVEYGRLRNHPDPAGVYDQVEAKFNAPQHPLLTRAVLVKRLFDVAVGLNDVSDLVSRLGREPRDYFHEFVLAVITREVNEKWLDRAGREGTVLLTVGEHLDLLASIAREMWVSTTDVLRHDVVDVVADIYCEETRRMPVIARQIKERIKHHALLTHSIGQRSGLAFDHEDFRSFFTGVALGRLCISGAREDLRSFLRVAGISETTADEAHLIFERSGKSPSDLILKLLGLVKGELSTSFVLENVGRLLLRALDGLKADSEVRVSGITFGPGSLAGKVLRNVLFEGCYFAPTSVEQSTFFDVIFENCRFERLELIGRCEGGAVLRQCDVACIVLPDELTLFDPTEIHKALIVNDFRVANGAVNSVASFSGPDELLLLTQRAVRIFMRSTQVNEETFRVRLGSSGGTFIDEVIPKLVRIGAFEKVPYRGSGRQERFRLVVAMSEIQEALTRSAGSFDLFLEELAGRKEKAKLLSRPGDP
jgi:hypothetical protein